MADPTKPEDKGKKTPEEELQETKAALAAAQENLNRFKTLEFPGKGGVPRKLGDVTTDEGYAKLQGELGKASEYETNRKEVKRLKAELEKKQAAKKPETPEPAAPEPYKAKTRQEILAANPELKQRVADGEADAIIEVAELVMDEKVKARTASPKPPTTPDPKPSASEQAGMTEEQVEQLLNIREAEGAPAAKAYAAEVARTLGTTTEAALEYIRGGFDEIRQERDDLTYQEYLAARAKALNIGPDGKPIAAPAGDGSGQEQPKPGHEPGDGTKQPHPASAGGAGAGGPGAPEPEKPLTRKEFDDQLRQEMGQDGTDAPGAHSFSPSSKETNRRLGSRAPGIQPPSAAERGVGDK